MDDAYLRLILGSRSPRRQEILGIAGYRFDVMTTDEEEVVDPSIDVYEMPSVIAVEKCRHILPAITGPGFVLVTADTVVIHRGEILGKPSGLEEAAMLLERLCGDKHEVVSGVCVHHAGIEEHFSVLTTVEFGDYSEEEIRYYLRHCHVTDKAGAYAIQEWIGAIGIRSIRGSYYNVMGLPIYELHKRLKALGIHPSKDGPG